MKTNLIIILLATLLIGCKSDDKNNKREDKGIQPILISKTHPYYYEKANGETWIPIMTNYLPTGNRNATNDDAAFALMEDYLKKFSSNGGNAMRIWISTDFLEIEDEKEGQYNPRKFQRIDKLIELAKKYGIYIKFTLQHIRTISADETNVNAWSNSTALATRFKDIREYVTTQAGIHSYLNRARALAEKYENCEQIYAWELWNEMDALPGDAWPPFTRMVLDSVKALFPNHLVVQTLGSLHSYDAEKSYKELFTYNNNEFASVHRYLELGNDWGQYDFIKGDVDTLVYTAMRFAQTYIKDRPIIMNEIGAVEPNHAGPFNYYKKDKEGMLIHDMVFAPFFCGSAGSGGMWHWDHYIYPNDLWYHFQRFGNAVVDFDPIKEMCENFTFSSDGVRCFGLKGKNKTIIWCRDTANNWRTELEKDVPPPTKENFTFNLTKVLSKQYTSARVYDPWDDKWGTVQVDNGVVKVPAFKRSVVLVLE